MIPNRPLLKRNYNVVMMPQGYMQLRSEENIFLLKGASVSDIVEKLLPLLNGKNTVDEIAEAFSEFSRETIEHVIEKLQDHYVIEDGDDLEKTGLSREIIEDYSPQIDYLSLFSERIIHDGTRVNKYELFETLHSKTCLVIGSGKVARSVVKELAENGVGTIILCADEDGGAMDAKKLSESFSHISFQKGSMDQIAKGGGIDMVVLAEDVTTDAKSRQVNKLCVDSNIPWIGLNMGETRFEVGPLVVPHETACYVCYMNRLNGNKSHLDEDMTYSNFKNLESDKVTMFTYDTMIRVAAGILVWEVVKYLSKVFSCVTTGRVIHFNILNLEMKSHTILKMPKCKVCSKVESVPFTEPYAVYLP